MPKAPSSRPSAAGSSSNPKQKHYAPLHQELTADEKLAKYGRVKVADGANASTGRSGKKGGMRDRKSGEGIGGPIGAADEPEEDTRVTSSRMSRKILDLARDQQAELSAEQGVPEGDEWEDEEDAGGSGNVASSSGTQRKPRDGGEDAGDEDMAEEEEEEVEEYEYDADDLDIDPEDYTTLDAIARGDLPPSLSRFLATGTTLPKTDPSQTKNGDGGFNTIDLEDSLPLGATAPGVDDTGDDGEPRTLADIIFAKMAEADAARSGGSAGVGLDKKVPGGAVQIPERRPDGTLDPRVGLNPKVVEVYTKVGHLLSRYKSGPLPRALKILPSLPHWARLLSLASPPTWTPHATFACTRIFVSNLKPDQVRVYLQGILLDRVRENMADLASSKSGKKGVRLDSQLYEALKKGLYKPAAFFKGVLFPLCEEGCSLREATIVASVLSKVSVPVLHSAAALLRLAGMDYTGPNSLFIRVLLDKKYALPYKVVDALVFHFIRLANSPRSKDGEDKLPVLWHQSLLVFVQRYGSDLTPDQKDALLDVIRARPHPVISSEIRRELISSVVRGEARPEEANAGDVVMG